MVLSNLLRYFFAVITVLLVSTPAWSQTTGTFMVVKGDVQVTSKDGKTEKAKIGKKVFPSDTITSGADSRAKIVMADKNVINISPDTKLILEKYIYDPANGIKNVSINVLQGKMRATVEQKYDGEQNTFNVKTPAAVAGVRGTDFLTSVDVKTNISKFVTFEGRVAVGLPGSNGKIVNPVFVTPGNQTTVSSGNPPAPPAAVPKDEMKNINDSSKAETASAPAPTPEGNSVAAEKSDSEKSSPEGEKQANSEPKKDGPPAEERAANEGPKKEDSGPKEQASNDGPKSESGPRSETKKEGPQPAPGTPAPVEGGFVGSGEAPKPAEPPPPGPGVAPKGLDARAPASPGGPVSMIDFNKDVGGLVGTGNIVGPSQPMLPGAGIYDPTKNLVAQPPPANTYVKDTLQNGAAKITVIIQPQN